MDLNLKFQEIFIRLITFFVIWLNHDGHLI